MKSAISRIGWGRGWLQVWEQCRQCQRWESNKPWRGSRQGKSLNRLKALLRMGKSPGKYVTADGLEETLALKQNFNRFDHFAPGAFRYRAFKTGVQSLIGQFLG